VILRESKGSKSLDDVMRLLWSEHEKPLQEDGFERAVASVCGVGDFFARYVHGTDPLPYDELFASVGVALTAATRERGLAANLRNDGGKLIVVSPVRGGAGMRAGLLPGDEIISIDGTRMSTEAETKNILESLDEGTAVEMLVSRAGVIRAMTLVAAPDPRVKITLRSTGENALRRKWLRRSDE